MGKLKGSVLLFWLPQFLVERGHIRKLFQELAKLRLIE